MGDCPFFLQTAKQKTAVFCRCYCMRYGFPKKSVVSCGELPAVPLGPVGGAL